MKRACSGASAEEECEGEGLEVGERQRRRLMGGSSRDEEEEEIAEEAAVQGQGQGQGSSCSSIALAALSMADSPSMETRWQDLDRLLLRPGNLVGPGFEPGPEVYFLLLIPFSLFCGFGCVRVLVELGWVVIWRVLPVCVCVCEISV